MPTLPLPPIDQGVPVANGDLPVATIDDVVAVWSQDIQASPTAPVRDAIQAGQLALFLAYQQAASYAAAQSDRLRATGEYLDVCGDEVGVHRQLDESDASYSARVNANPTVTDPVDIVAAANAILAPFTSISARYMEHPDGVYLGSSDTQWSAHLFAKAGPNTTPNYPDRLYVDVTPAGLQPLPLRRPGGAVLFGDPYGRVFILRVPDIAAIDTVVTALYDGTETDPDSGVFLGGPSTADAGVSFMWSIQATSFDIYNTIIGSVEAIRGHSIRWVLFADPKLLA